MTNPLESTPAAGSCRTGLSRPVLRRAGLRLLAAGLLLFLVSTAIVACGTAAAANPTASPEATAQAAAPASSASGAAVQEGATAASPSPSPNYQPLTPTSAGADPVSLISWAFTPIFQVLFILLADFYALTGNVLIAIALLTLLIRLVTIRLSAKQIVSQQRMQRLQPEIRALQKELERRYKGDKAAVYQAQQAFYKERGVSPTAGCLPSVLQMGMLIPMYSVIRLGLTNYDPSAMFKIFGLTAVPITCPNPSHIVNGVLDKSQPCINTVIAGIDMGKEQVLFSLPIPVFGAIGISALALIAAFFQLVQSRQMMPPPAENDPSASSARTMMVIMPLFSIIYGAILPAGLFVYWILTSVFSIVQQFLIIGWGNMFPLFGWNPSFAANYKPRFPVTMPAPATAGKSLADTRYKPEERSASAASTVRPNPHRRAGRRGRRR